MQVRKCASALLAQVRKRASTQVCASRCANLLTRVLAQVCKSAQVGLCKCSKCNTQVLAQVHMCASSLLAELQTRRPRPIHASTTNIVCDTKGFGRVSTITAIVLKYGLSVERVIINEMTIDEDRNQHSQQKLVITAQRRQLECLSTHVKQHS